MALQNELQALKDQNVALAAERDRIQQSFAELRASAQPPPDLRARQEELDRQRKEIEGRIRETDATAKQARQALEAEQCLRNKEHRQAVAREQELNAQLLAARRAGLQSSPAISGRSKQMWIGTVVVVAMLAAGIGVAVFLSNRPQVNPSGDIEPMVEAMSAVEFMPAVAPAPLVPAPVVEQDVILPTIELIGLQAKPVGEGLQIIFDNGVFSRRAIMSDEARAMLKELAWQLRPAMPACHLEITGHTDPEVARNADAPDNKALGYQRARAVAEYLATECALPAGAISVASAGDANAPYPNTTPELRRKNRTVTLVVIPFKE
ncbi:OmpA family protein [Verrucomicrobiota bacterium]